MAKESIYNVNIETPVQVTREQYVAVGSGENILGDIKRAVLGGTDFQIWTASSGGTQLVEDTDYELVNQDLAYTSRAGADVFTGFKILNATYQTGSIYITYKVIGSYVTAELAGVGLKRNLMINSQFRHWQRGISFTNVSNSQYTADRWKVQKNNGSGTAPNFDVARDYTDGINHYLKITPTSTGTLGASLSAGVYQHFEFYASIKGKPVSLRVRAKAPSGKSFRILIYDGVTSKSTIFTGCGEFAEYVVEDFTVSASATALGIYYQIAVDAVFIPAINDYHYIDRVQLTNGETAPPFIVYDEIMDLEKCKRYYENNYAEGIYPGALNLTGRFITRQEATETNILNISDRFSVAKRITPTMTWYSPDTGASGYIYNVTTDADVAISSTLSTSNKKTGSPVAGSAVTSGDTLYAFWAADSEI